jgi:hypothetical protein
VCIKKPNKLDFSKCQNLTTKACCVSKSAVLCICKEAKKGKEEGTKKVSLSLSKHINIPKRMTNLYDFKKYVSCRIVFKYYEKGELPTVKKVTLALKQKSKYKGSVHILFIYSYKIHVLQFYSYVVHSNISFLILLLHTHVQNNKLAMLRQLPIFSCQTSRNMNPMTSACSFIEKTCNL